MKERPILFSAPMVRAILEGRKTMTRRVIKNQCEHIGIGRDESGVFVHRHCEHDTGITRCPYGQPGDRLWVRETFLYDYFMHENTAGIPDLPDGQFSHRIVYRASNPDHPITVGSEKWKPSIFMPRKYSRITLEITNVRVERLQDISEEYAKQEGFPDVVHFYELWTILNGKESWRANPWVWVVEFKRVA